MVEIPFEGEPGEQLGQPIRITRFQRPEDVLRTMIELEQIPVNSDGPSIGGDLPPDIGEGARLFPFDLPGLGGAAIGHDVYEPDPRLPAAA